MAAEFFVVMVVDGAGGPELVAAPFVRAVGTAVVGEDDIVFIDGERGAPGLLMPATFQFLHAPLAGKNYGMGWGVDSSNAQIGAVLEHTGSNTNWLAQVGLIPALEFGVLVVTNAGGAKAQAAVDAMGDLIAQRFIASM